MRVDWTPLAEERVRQFVGSMRADRTGAAWRWLQGLLGRLRGLSRNAERGLVVNEIGDLGDSAGAGTVREIAFAPCRIIYRIESRRMVILTILPAGRHRKSARYEERARAAPRAARDRSSTA